MQRHEMSFSLIEIPIDRNEGLSNLVAPRIFELISISLSCLCVFCDSEAANSY